MGGSAALEVDQKVIAVGNPLALHIIKGTRSTSVGFFHPAR